MTQMHADGKQNMNVRARRFQTRIRMAERSKNTIDRGPFFFIATKRCPQNVFPKKSLSIYSKWLSASRHLDREDVFLDWSNETVFDTKSRKDALRIAQDASPGILRRCQRSPVGTFEAYHSVPCASLVAFEPVSFYPCSKTYNGQIGLLLRSPFHTPLRDYRSVFPVSLEFLLGYSQTVPTGLTCPS